MRQTGTDKLQFRYLFQLCDRGNESNTFMFSSKTLSSRKIPNLIENIYPLTALTVNTVEHETGAGQNLNFVPRIFPPTYKGEALGTRLKVEIWD